MSPQANKEIVRRFIDDYQTGGDEASLLASVAPNVVDHSRPPGIAEGVSGVRQQFDGFHAAFPDFRAEVLDMIAEDDRVMTHKIFHGTHQGELMGIPPTGRAVQISVIDIVRLRDGQIVEHWNVVDRLGLLQQLGVVEAA